MSWIPWLGLRSFVLHVVCMYKHVIQYRSIGRAVTGRSGISTPFFRVGPGTEPKSKRRRHGRRVVEEGKSRRRTPGSPRPFPPAFHIQAGLESRHEGLYTRPSWDRYSLWGPVVLRAVSDYIRTGTFPDLRGIGVVTPVDECAREFRSNRRKIFRVKFPFLWVGHGFRAPYSHHWKAAEVFPHVTLTICGPF
jgi:hypothetical protein